LPNPRAYAVLRAFFVEGEGLALSCVEPQENPWAPKLKVLQSALLRWLSAQVHVPEVAWPVRLRFYATCFLRGHPIVAAATISVMYHFLDIFFLVLHSALIVFNCLGWIFKKTRRLNLITLLLTAFSWFVLGLWKGLGYCFLVDWHWEVRRKLGYTDMPSSYIKFLLDEITGFDWNENTVEVLTSLGFSVALIMSISLNVRDYLRYRRHRTK
jgi:hypothetical protein